MKAITLHQKAKVYKSKTDVENSTIYRDKSDA